MITIEQEGPPRERTTWQVTIGHHPGLGVVATGVPGSAFSDRALRLLGFRRSGEHPGLHVLADQSAGFEERVAEAVELLRGAGCTVHADAAFDPAARPAPADRAPQEEDTAAR